MKSLILEAMSQHHCDVETWLSDDCDSVAVCCLCQRGESASDRARDADMKSLILEAMSQHHCEDGEMTTESCLETMRSEISSAAVQHRNLVEQLTSSAPLSHSSSADTNSSDRLVDNNSTDRHSASGSSRTCSLSSASATE